MLYLVWLLFPTTHPFSDSCCKWIMFFYFIIHFNVTKVNRCCFCHCSSYGLGKNRADAWRTTINMNKARCALSINLCYLKYSIITTCIFSTTCVHVIRVIQREQKQKASPSPAVNQSWQPHPLMWKKWHIFYILVYFVWRSRQKKQTNI